MLETGRSLALLVCFMSVRRMSQCRRFLRLQVTMGIACAVYVLVGACCIFHTAVAHQLPGDSQAHFEQQTAQQNCQAAAERTSVTLDALCPMSDRLSSACCDKLAAFESTQCFW